MVLWAAEEVLQGTGAVRVHGGGFAGTVQAFVPNDKLPAFLDAMEPVSYTHLDVYKRQGIREAEGIPHLHLPPVLDHRVIFSSRVPGRLLHPGQDALQTTIHDKPPSVRSIFR